MRRTFFAVHILSIGMADLATQIYTVFLIVVPTILTVSKFSCDDSEWMSNIKRFLGIEEQPEVYIAKVKGNDDASAPVLKTCYMGTSLKAETYEFPLTYDPKYVSGFKREDRAERRQDLYAWLQLTFEEQDSMDKWDLFPHIRNDHDWWNQYTENARKLRPTPGVALFKEGTILAVNDERSARRWKQAHRKHPSPNPHNSASPTEINEAVANELLLMSCVQENSAFPTSGGQEQV